METLPAAVPLYLDHASIVVPDLAAALDWLDHRLGLKATITPAASDSHSRVYLDRSYLEVRRQEAVSTWALEQFFLRFDDLSALECHLETAGFKFAIDTYRGVDGSWDDVEVQSEAAELPVLVRRTQPPEIARDWPPPLRRPHPCGARALEAVVAGVTDLTAAAVEWARLAGLAEPPRAADSSVAIPLAAGRVILVEDEHPGIAGLVFKVESLAATKAAVGPLEGTPIAWLAPAAAHGLRLGFVEESTAA